MAFRSGAVTFITGSAVYATPARAIASYWRMFEQFTAADAAQIRIAGDVPHEGNGGRFTGWDRYESAHQHRLGPVPHLEPLPV